MVVQAVTGILNQVDGSSQFESKNTKVICSVTGPIEPKARQELPTRLALEVIVRPARGIPNTREKLIEDKLRAVLTPLIVSYKYPRQLCQITCQILEAGESEEEFSQRELSCCINAAFLALIDAGIALHSMVSSVCLCIAKDTDELVIDPGDDDLRVSRSVHTLALELVKGGSVIQNVLLLDSVGDFTEEQLFEILQNGEQSCVELTKELRRIISDKISEDIVRTHVA
ncbi:hypothetical protein HG535_0B06010 [Zygotorulaspora mrakii]|uniref:Uncharacterized protein n=1 Tax=Zygotorulaspora mrakii TaxID=42260 RepID=A0A7H9AZF0_ZYGMR|nr:uncharacterized protein HG535_0B06010 [Zygotorulaspora mrakii]QLG71557.1 hypothetical protein HG535_0B06010 [Zygotorulaspora mrakii]